jgi:hypothetical protein
MLLITARPTIGSRWICTKDRRVPSRCECVAGRSARAALSSELHLEALEVAENRAEARPALRGVTQGATADGTPLVSIWFRFDLQPLNGKQAVFDVVDLLELAADERIDALHIIYDTADVRTAVGQEKG